MYMATNGDLITDDEISVVLLAILKTDSNKLLNHNHMDDIKRPHAKNL